MTDEVDWNDPCARLQALSTAYYKIISGAQEVEIRTRNLDAEELVRFTPANLQWLWIELRGAENECARKQGVRNPNGRFAIGLSYRPAGRVPATQYDPTDPRN